jgi:hypothetical protein
MRDRRDGLTYRYDHSLHWVMLEHSDEFQPRCVSHSDLIGQRTQILLDQHIDVSCKKLPKIVIKW